MTHILVVSPQTLITQAAEELKNQRLVEFPSWAKFVKTGRHKERLPDNFNWWFYRSAAVLRSVAKCGPIGTEKLRTKYGGLKGRGHKPERFYKGSGSIIREILQQLEQSGLVKQEQKGVHKGRVLTPKGTSFLDKLAVQISKSEHKACK